MSQRVIATVAARGDPSRSAPRPPARRRRGPEPGRRRPGARHAREPARRRGRGLVGRPAAPSGADAEPGLELLDCAWPTRGPPRSRRRRASMPWPTASGASDGRVGGRRHRAGRPGRQRPRRLRPPAHTSAPGPGAGRRGRAPTSTCWWTRSTPPRPWDGDIDRALTLLGRPVPGLAPADGRRRPPAPLALPAARRSSRGRRRPRADRDPCRAWTPHELYGVARWLDGDPSGLVARPGRRRPRPATSGSSERDRFERAALVVLTASADEAAMVHDRARRARHLAFRRGLRTGRRSGRRGPGVQCAGRPRRRPGGGRHRGFVGRAPRPGDGHVPAPHPGRPLRVSPDVQRDWDAADVGPSSGGPS